MDIIWENPPSGRGRATDNTEELEIAKALRAQPGAWARIKELEKPSRASAVVTAINAGTRNAFAVGFEAKSRSIEGKGVVYCRFVGSSTSS